VLRFLKNSHFRHATAILKPDTSSLLFMKGRIMRKTAVSAVFIMAIMLGAGGAYAETPSLPKPPDISSLLELPDAEMIAQMEKFRAGLKDLTPEQRDQMRAARRAKMESLSPEQRKVMHEKLKQRLDAMTPEQRERFRAAMGKDPREGGPLRTDKLQRLKEGQAPKRVLPPPPIEGGAPAPGISGTPPAPPPALPE